MGIPEKEIDIQRIDNNIDLQNTWDMWAGYPKADALFFYSHGNETGAEVAYGTAPDFWKNAKKLNWTYEYHKNDYASFAAFFGCNTAKGDFAQNFANSQNVVVYAQQGYAVFSRDPKDLYLIDESGPVYLNFFEKQYMKVTIAKLIGYTKKFGENTNRLGMKFVPK